MISVFDLYTIGIGPSSSHTVGPMRAASMFARRLRDARALMATQAVEVELYGSLGATGRGHGTDRAVVVGLEGETPEAVDPRAIEATLERVRATRRLRLLGARDIDFDIARDLVFRPEVNLPPHPNGLRFTARDRDGAEVLSTTFFSVGGGFVTEAGVELTGVKNAPSLPHPFSSTAELLAWTRSTRRPISGVVLANERTWLDEPSVRGRLHAIHGAMRACIEAGCATEGVLPGGLGVPRRAPAMHRRLRALSVVPEPLGLLDWVALFALAVNEENAAGGRVVTAPTNGAAGIVPAVLEYLVRFAGGDREDVVRYLLTAGAIGIICKQSASISGSEVGCQGEVGSACAMAAAGLAEVMGGAPEQVENAAEIAMEHNLGLTCDPIGGLVQVPCIERNAVGAVKAIVAARMALHGDGTHHVSFDAVLRTMRETGRDMKDEYKETARGGLAVNVVEC